MTLNDYITIHAGRMKDAEFLKQFIDTEIFFPILESSQPLIPGSTVPVGVQLRHKVAKLEVGRMVVFYASKLDPRLGKPFGGLLLSQAMELVCKLEDVDGILIHNDADQWFAANKPAIKDLLESPKP